MCVGNEMSADSHNVLAGIFNVVATSPPPLLFWQLELISSERHDAWFDPSSPDSNEQQSQQGELSETQGND